MRWPHARAFNFVADMVVLAGNISGETVSHIHISLMNKSIWLSLNGPMLGQI